MKSILLVFSIIVMLLSETNAQVFTNYTEEDGLPVKSITSIAIDAEGNKWFGSYFIPFNTGWGVSKFDDTIWTNYTMEDGLMSNIVHSIAIDAEDNKWFVGSPCWAGGDEYKGGGVSKFDGTNWTNYTEEDGLASNSVSSIAIDAEGNKWFGTGGGGGVSKYDGADWTTYTVPALKNYHANSIAIDAEGNKWFGFYWGVVKYDGANWTTYISDGRVIIGVHSIAIDAEDNKWCSTSDGVSKFDGSNWTSYTTEDGLANNSVSSIAIDAEGNKWFGTGGGVSKFDGTDWTNYTEEDGLASNYVSSIAIDAEGNKWFGTQYGVSKLSDDNTGAILKLTKENHLKIYPNPVNSLLTIESDQPDHHSIEITSLNGQLIYRTKMEGSSKQIDLSPFSKGIYFITVRSDGWVRTEKVVRY